MKSANIRKYGVETTINFNLYEIDGIELRSDAVYASGDVKVMKDEGDEANSTNGFTDEGQGYSIVLTATEMTAKRIAIYIVDQTSPKVWLSEVIYIETYGNANAQHPTFPGDSDASIVQLKQGLLPVATTIASTGTTTTCVLSAGDTHNNAYIGMLIVLDNNEGNNNFVSRTITAYNGSSKTVTFTPAIEHDAQNGSPVYIIPSNTKINPVVDSIKTKTDQLVFTTANRVDSTVIDKTGFSLATTPPTAQQIWEYVTRVLTAGTRDSQIDSIKSTVDTNLNATVSSRSSHSAADVWSVSVRSLSTFGTLVSDIATAVWSFITRTITSGTKDTEIDNIKAKTDQLAFTTSNRVDSSVVDKTGFTISGTKQTLDALNDISETTVNAQCDQALSDYDAPTNAEMIARSLPTASYATATSISALNNVSVAQILAGVIETGYTLKDVMQIMVAVLAGKTDGGDGSVYNFRNILDSLNRVQVTVDENDNRTVVTIVKD